MNEINEIKTWLLILLVMVSAFYGAFIYGVLLPKIEKWVNETNKNLEKKISENKNNGGRTSNYPQQTIMEGNKMNAKKDTRIDWTGKKLLYCQETVKECYWTRTGQCKATYAYNCNANLSLKEQARINKIEAESERQYCADAAEAEWGNEIN